ncbi:hypothetical protein HPB50_002374 [Hyalomma asiaticum]|uniref:Uncharacterized protein n=1 Tax=Hyalomma asiaticum TaxID=266040 RepID=A0ACB7THD0_HYAAI|nr:hypothetical protein HPB50_002374 [Hyalomma asiaticum]
MQSSLEALHNMVSALANEISSLSIRVSTLEINVQTTMSHPIFAQPTPLPPTADNNHPGNPPQGRPANSHSTYHGQRQSGTCDLAMELPRLQQ